MPDHGKTSILIVDDLPEKILVYRTVLEELDQDLVTANSGAEALKQVLKHDFAVILLDVNMPDMDGFETARLIRQRRLSAHVPIIFLTAFADEFRITEAYTAGVDYLPTPVVPEVLRAKVRVFVDLYLMRQQVARQAEEQAKRAAAEEAARRSEFLADASRVLTSSLDFEATIRGLLRVAVPRLADLAAVTLFSGAAQDWRSELAWEDADGLQFQTLAERHAPQDALRAAHDRVLETGIAESLRGLDVVNPFGSEGPARRIQAAQIFPLRARGRTLGALTLGTSESERDVANDDRIILEDFAGRAAIALDNARLYRDIQENDLRKDEFLAMLAHELRNPLAPVRTGLDLLAMTGSDPTLIEPMRRQVEHLVRLVDDLLDVSRITRGAIDLRLQAVDVKKVIASAVETSRPLIEARRHELSVAATEGPLRVSGDPVRLAQIVTNLLNNAAKYTPDGGEISLEVERDGEEILIRVCDTGSGIPREMLARVFDLFVQAERSLDRAQGGLGIGLTLVRRLVEMHGGSVEAFSDGPGSGSEFVVRLPAQTIEVEAEEPPPRPALRVESPACRILVVDDNVDAAATLGMLLRLGGHDVRLAHDGASALELAPSFAPSVVLLDIGLPGLDGYEVARRLRRLPETETSLLVAVSGYGRDEDRRRAQAAGFDHHLTKPVDFGALKQVLPRQPSHAAAG